MLTVSLTHNADGSWLARVGQTHKLGSLTECYEWLGALAGLL